MKGQLILYICKKNFWAFLRGEIQIFVKKGLPKFSFKIGSNFSVILRFSKTILLFADKVRCLQLLGKNMIDI